MSGHARRQRRRRYGSAAWSTPVWRLLAGPELMPISTAMVGRASHVGSASLASLDALQLATALSLADDRAALGTYDRQPLDAAAF